jgi:hypothetical protein
MFLKRRIKKLVQFFRVKWRRKWRPFFNLERDGLEAIFYAIASMAIVMLTMIVINHFVTTSTYYYGYLRQEAFAVLPIFWWIFVKIWALLISWWFSPLLLYWWWFTPLVTLLAVGGMLGSYTLKHTTLDMTQIKRGIKKIKIPRFRKRRFKITKRTPGPIPKRRRLP